MKGISRYFRSLSILGFLLIAFINCDGLHVQNPFNTNQKSYGTETGNALTSSELVAKACLVITKAHPLLTQQDCFSGVAKTSFSNSLGVPPQILNPFSTLIEAEAAGAIHADSESLEKCLSDLAQVDPNSPEVVAAYDLSHFNPFNQVAEMISTLGEACANVYRNNHFTPPVIVPPPPGITVMTFDEAVPPAEISLDWVRGVHGDIDFGINQDWFWQSPFDANTTNSLSPNGQLPAHFSFASGPKKMLSIRFSTQQSGTVTVSDDNGQSASLFIPADSQMHTLNLNFAFASNVITINFPFIWKLSLDDITYQNSTQDAGIYFRQSAETTYNANQIALPFNSDNSTGNTLIVATSWDPGFSLGSVSDTQGNVYRPASDVINSPDFQYVPGPRYQIWYASNIKAGSNTVKISLQGAATTGPSVPYRLFIFEYAGLDPVNPIDAISTQMGDGHFVDTGRISTHYPNELIFAYVSGEQDVVNLDPGFITRNSTSPSTHVIVDQVTKHTGIFQAKGSLIAPMSPWIGQILSFKGLSQP